MNVGFIGLGNMGNPMSAQLVRDGYEVWGYDISSAAMERAVENGVKKATSGAEVAKYCDRIICMMPQTTNTKEALFGEGGVVENLRPGMIIVDMCTGSPTDTKEINAKLKALGVGHIDAPVSGGVVKAVKGTLSIMAAGEEEVFRKVEDLFQSLGEDVFYVGESGTGHTIKLINNLLTGINLAAICEAMVMGTKAGIDPNLLLNVINSSSGESYSSRVKIPGFVFKRKFDGGFKVVLQHKDMTLATALAKDLCVPTVLGNVAKEYYSTAIACGYGDEDASAVIKEIEHVCGVEVPLTVVS